MEYCYGSICLVQFAENAPKFFGFSELLAGLALMVLAWTTADARYKFRINTAPLPLQGITYTVVGAVGVLTLLTDLWRAEQWYVLEVSFLTSSGWQAILGALFLLTFLTWAWFAFISPPVFGKRNAKRYTHTLYRAILKGDPLELIIIADELTHSAKALIYYATDKDKYDHRIRTTSSGLIIQDIPPEVVICANEILLLIGDKRFCRAVVGSSPGTALAFFDVVRDTKKYGVNLEIFSSNILNEALLNKESFLYHEAEGYEAGLIGYHKPLSQAMFSNHKMVEGIGTILDANFLQSDKLDSDRLKAYTQVILITFKDYVINNFLGYSPALYTANMNILNALSDLYKVNGVTRLTWDDEILVRLRIVIRYINSAIEILDKIEPPKYIVLRNREYDTGDTYYDYLAVMIYTAIEEVSLINSPASLSLFIQNNLVWEELFSFKKMESPSGKIIKFKVRRLIYNEILSLKEAPNLRAACILSFCLNVLGLNLRKQKVYKESKALHKAVLSWTKKNYAWLNSYDPKIAAGCLVEGFTYDDINSRIIKTYPSEGLRRKPKDVFFYVDSNTCNSEII